MAAPEPAQFDLGCRVRVMGLVQAAHHNGKMGVVITPLDLQTGRIGVELEDGSEVRIKPCNMQLQLYPDDAAPAAAQASAAEPTPASPISAASSESETDRFMLDYMMRQGMSLEQARRSIAVIEKKKTDNVTAAIEYAASVKKDEGIKQHLARFGLKNVIKDCGDWSRFPGMMKILAQLDAAGAADNGTLRMLFGSERHVAGMLEELRDMRTAPNGSPASAMGQSLFQDDGRRRAAQCCVCGKSRSQTTASFRKCSGCRGPELYCSDSDCFASNWTRHKPLCFQRRGAVVAPEDIAARDAVLEEESREYLRKARELQSQVDQTLSPKRSTSISALFSCCVRAD